MAAEKKNLGAADTVSSMLRSNAVFVEVGGSVRRISLDDFMNSINQGDEQLLRQVAWGVPLKQTTQSSPSWGRVGNLTMWEQYKEKMGDYLLTNTGKAAKLSTTDRTVYADGTPVDETAGNIMFMAPRLYYLVRNDALTSIPYLWMSELPIGGHYIEAPCVGAYKAYNLGGTMVSRSGYKPTGSQNITTFWNQARKNGNDFGLVNYEHRKFFMMLLLSEYGNPNAQEMIGYGCSGDGSTWDATNALLTGATASLGDACGAISISDVAGNSKSSRVSLFGIEDLWGWYWEMTQGVYFGNSGNSAQDGSEIFLYEGNRMPTSAELAAHPNGNYRQLTRVTSGSGSYIRTMILGEHFDIFPNNISGGNSNSYWTDGWWSNATGQLLLWGGGAISGAGCGLACSASNHAFSHTYPSFGSRLAFYGTPTIVNGADI